MPRLPDRFDLWVRQARACADPARQLDFVLGALVGLPQWRFLNAGTLEHPRIFTTEMDGAPLLLVFSDVDRVEEIAGRRGLEYSSSAPPVISIPTTIAAAWCLGPDVPPWDALLINPGEDAVLVPRPQVETFLKEWEARGARQAAGFWIPNLTSEEEDFWQEHGV
jgi:hypothetical protein